MKYQNREQEIRATISKENAVRLIEETYHAVYVPENVSFDVYDQLLACEAVAESSPVTVKENINNYTSDKKSSINGSNYDSYKR